MLVSDYLCNPLFISMSNWGKKIQTKSIVFTSLLCLRVPWSIFKKKIFENVYNFFHTYLSIQIFYLLLRQLGEFILSEHKRNVFIGTFKFYSTDLHILFDNAMHNSTFPAVSSSFYFLFSEGTLFHFLGTQQSTLSNSLELTKEKNQLHF